MKARLPTQAQHPQPHSFLPLHRSVLQRKCACGGTPGPTGECAECAKKSKFLQRKLKIGASNDPLEDEADRVADQVLAGPTDPAVNGAPLRIQRFTGQPAGEMGTAPASVDRVLASAGRPLDPTLRKDMEQRFGHDFSRVRVHSGPAAEQSTRDVNARAYTVGENMVFGAGQLAPATRAGRRLIAHELTHVVQRSSGDGGQNFHDAQQSPSCVTRKPATIVQRRETGSDLDDPLYMEDRKWSSGQGPDDRITGRKLQNWAIARGSLVIRGEEALRRMQEKDGAEADIVEDVYSILIDLLWGHDARSPYDTSSTFVGEGPHFRLATEQTRLDKFDGSDNARGAAVLELGDHWGPIALYFTRALMTRYRDSFLEALGRTPRDMTLEEDTEVIKRIRTHPYCHSHKIEQGMVGEVGIRCGQRWGMLHVVDIYKSLGSGSEATGADVLWASRPGYPLWYYHGSLGLINRDAVSGEVARGAAESAQFAAHVLPLIIKAAGLALSFSPSPFIVIASVATEELGEEGFRDLSGEGRSFKDIASSAARGILVNLIVNKLFGGGGEGKEASEAAGALDRVAEKAVSRMRDSVEKEIVHSEGAKISHAIEAGQGRSVTDQTFTNEGFTFEVKIQHEGGQHIYRRKADGEWCRWSSRICFDKEVEEELRKLGGYQHGFEGPKGDVVSDPLEAGNVFNTMNVPRGAESEIQLVTPSGRRPRVDLYLKGKEIISRKFPMGQLADDEFKALEYLQELRIKYPPKAPIRSAKLRGEVLEGVQVLEVPVQFHLPLPKMVLDYANSRHIVIRDIEGTIYNPEALGP